MMPLAIEIFLTGLLTLVVWYTQVWVKHYRDEELKKPRQRTGLIEDFSDNHSDARDEYERWAIVCFIVGAMWATWSAA